jgi:hypothetical protein
MKIVGRTLSWCLVAAGTVNPIANLAAVGRNALVQAPKRGSHGHPIIYQ